VRRSGAPARISGGGRAFGAHLGSGGARGADLARRPEAAPIGLEQKRALASRESRPAFPFPLPSSPALHLTLRARVGVFSFARQKPCEERRERVCEGLASRIEIETWMFVCRRRYRGVRVI
jgi:hypothetical protein